MTADIRGSTPAPNLPDADLDALEASLRDGVSEKRCLNADCCGDWSRDIIAAADALRTLGRERERLLGLLVTTNGLTWKDRAERAEAERDAARASVEAYLDGERPRILAERDAAIGRATTLAAQLTVLCDAVEDAGLGPLTTGSRDVLRAVLSRDSGGGQK